MRIGFTKMHGAGNDFVVLDETRTRLGLSAAHYRFLADRHFGVGADQILTVRTSPAAGIDFEYLIHNADGQEVEHCGNGARCFLNFVRQRGLTNKEVVSVKTMNRVLELRRDGAERVIVDMGLPVFDLRAIPFDPGGLVPRHSGNWQIWPLGFPGEVVDGEIAVAVLSMGNPHAVCVVENVENAPVATLGPLIAHHASFPRRVNAWFMQIVDRTHISLRVFERGVGETLSCGTGACAAVVAGCRLGLLDGEVEVATRGGHLGITWNGADSAVLMTGPARTVFEGEIDLPEQL